MSAAWQVRLRGAWADLADRPAQGRAYRTRTLAPECPMDAYAGLRALDNAPCLLLRGPAGEDMLFELGGLRLHVDRDDQGTFLVLSLEDATQRDLFTTLCADAIETAGEESTQAPARFHERLNAWRAFLRESRSGLSREDTAGLIGELLVLELLLGVNAGLLATWLAPDRALHDFLNAGHALEIKTSAGASSRLRISTLDQLDDAGLRRLDLVHVRLIEDPDGRTLSGILDALAAMLPDEASRQALANAVLRRGLNPDDDHSRHGLRVSLRSLDVYTVDARFPRLLRADVPMAVADASYALELRALAGHASDTEASLSHFAAGGAA